MEPLEQRTLLASLPFGAMPDDTAEYLLGTVAVTPVFFESNGSIDASREDWSPALIAQTKAKIEEGVQWWAETLDALGSVHSLQFQFDYTYADNPVATGYEPISRISNDYLLWGQDFLQLVGFHSGGASTFNADVRAFNQAQRAAHDANWAFTIFVVNSELDPDDSFAPGGAFDRAFAFAGGLFFVSPSGRPPSTFAHETGHIFYAKDEYLGGGTYTDCRGYYNTQNLNAANNPAPGFVQAESIMAVGQLLAGAYEHHTSAPSTLEMVGWKDSDGDGVFDVLDVPHSLSGAGYYDAQLGAYRFVGASSVQTLPNLNPSGLRNDITINEISRAQYRLDGGAWTTAAVYHAYTAVLDLTIPVAPGRFQTIEIRTIDDATGVSSPVFLGHPSRRSSTGQPGINGFVWRDQNGDGVWGPEERALSGWTVQLVDSLGAPVQLADGVEPDDFPSGLQLLNDVNPAVHLQSIGDGVADSAVLSSARDAASTGSRVFAHFLWGGQISAEWTAQNRKLKMTFAEPVTTVSLDAVGNSDYDYGRLEIYDAQGQLLGRYTTQALAQGACETMTLSRPTAEIAYAIASGHAGTAVRFDNLRFGPEATAVSDAQGAFSIAYLQPGDYLVQVVAPNGWNTTCPSPATHSVSLDAGEVVQGVDFGVQSAGPMWQNPGNRYDVNNDGGVSALDALAVINDLNAYGARQLPLPGEGRSAPAWYVDVNGDGFASPLDALMVINLLNAGGASEPRSGSVAGAARGPGLGEGESSGAFRAPLGCDDCKAADLPVARGAGNQPAANDAVERPLGSDRQTTPLGWGACSESPLVLADRTAAAAADLNAPLGADLPASVRVLELIRTPDLWSGLVARPGRADAIDRVFAQSASGGGLVLDREQTWPAARAAAAWAKSQIVCKVCTW